MAKTLRKNVRDDIVAQCLDEIRHARLHKRAIVREWEKNENIINEVDSKLASENVSARTLDKKPDTSHLALHKASGFIQTVMSKIDTPLSFMFTAQHDGDKRGAELLNALVEADSETDIWNFKDLLGKEQAIVYGRAIYSYYATSDGEYKANLTNIDVYDFLIDPNCGGLDLQNARFCGAYNIRFDKQDLQKGVEDGRFISTEVKEILQGDGNNDEVTQEEQDKTNRYYSVAKNSQRKREKYDPNVFKFWNWYTTYNGERYYVVLSETSGKAIRIEKLEDITKSNLFPFWSFAIFPSLTEFWSPSYIGNVREIFMAQNITINQMLLNADKINNPQRAINVDAILDESELRYKKNGKIRFKGDQPINNVFEVFETPSIDTPIAVYETLENIVQLASGVTNAVQGAAEEEKVGIYEGNISATSDRFNLLNKSYSNGYRHFAELYKWGVQEHLKQKKAVKIIGPEGVEVENINYKDIKPFEDYLTSVQSSTAESQADIRDKRDKLQFLSAYIGSGIISDQNAFEMQAELVGFDPQDIRRLLDTKNTIKSKVIQEAARDVEYAIMGREPKINLIADNAYLDYIYRYMRDKQENLKPDQFRALMELYAMNEPIARDNMIYEMQKEQIQQGGYAPQGVDQQSDLQQQEYPEQTQQGQLQDVPPEQQVAGDVQAGGLQAGEQYGQL